LKLFLVLGPATVPEYGKIEEIAIRGEGLLCILEPCNT
jgi:hypothetical protein